MVQYMLVALAGSVGAVLRYSVGIIVTPIWVGAFPLATFLANAFGSFLLAFLSAVFEKNAWISPLWQPAITTGLIGSFTTFSTFSVETVILFRDHSPLAALAYVMASGLTGFAFALIGFSLGSRISGEEVR